MGSLAGTRTSAMALRTDVYAALSIEIGHSFTVWAVLY
jgi:hypothetical protein